MYELYLAHHGIVGMKWGVRRYQNPDGSLTAAGKLRYAPDGNGGYRKLTGSERRAAEKSAKQRAAALEKARKARLEKAEYEKGKQDALKTGDASKIDKYFNDLDPNEQRQALERMRTKQEFQRMLNNEAQLISQGESKMDKLMNTVGKVTDWSEKGIKMYNVIAKVNNAFSDNFMPQIGSGESRSEHNKKLRKEAEEERAAKKEKAEKAKAAKELEAKTKLINNGSAEEILAYAKKTGKLSGDELAKAYTRIENESKLGNVNVAREKERVLASGSAAEILRYAYKNGNFTDADYGTAINSLKNQYALATIAKGGSEAKRILNTPTGKNKNNKGG